VVFEIRSFDCFNFLKVWVGFKGKKMDKGRRHWLCYMIFLFHAVFFIFTLPLDVDLLLAVVSTFFFGIMFDRVRLVVNSMSDFGAEAIKLQLQELLELKLLRLYYLLSISRRIFSLLRFVEPLFLISWFFSNRLMKFAALIRLRLRRLFLKLLMGIDLEKRNFFVKWVDRFGASILIGLELELGLHRLLTFEKENLERK